MKKTKVPDFANKVKRVSVIQPKAYSYILLEQGRQDSALHVGWQ